MPLDSHQHFWQLGRFDTSWLDVPRHARIRRDYLPADLKPLIDAAGVQRTVFVQTQHAIEENRWALQLANEHDWIAGVVGWVDLAGPECEEQLLEFTSQPKFVGLRHVTQDEPDVDFIVRPDVLRGLKVLQKHDVPFDLLFYVKHLHHAQRLARELPDLRMVIDHLSKPRIREQAASRTLKASGTLLALDDWEANFRAAAKCPNVWCKLSGMITEADWRNWKPADLRPYVQVALEAFGPERLMFGSDWPVCELAGSYQQVMDALNEALGPISPTERERIFGGTGRDFYRLPVN
jgi:L-fuconolactonase